MKWALDQSTALEDTRMANPAPAPDATGEINPHAARGSSSYPGTPRWVKVSGIVAVMVILLVALIMVLGGGEHGPMRHMPSGSGETNTPPIAAGT